MNFQDKHHVRYKRDQRVGRVYNPNYAVCVDYVGASNVIWYIVTTHISGLLEGEKIEYTSVYD
jgi:hypothetical protein